MPRRRKRRYLRFWQRGRCRWVEIVAESHPARTARRVTLSGRVKAYVAGHTIENFGDFGNRFFTSALSSAPRILFFEEADSDPAPTTDVACVEPGDLRRALHSGTRRRRPVADRQANVREVVERLQALPPAALDALRAAEARELAPPPRNPVIVESARLDAQYLDLSGLRAFKERVLRNLPASLQLESRPTVRTVEPLPLIAAQPRNFTAFIDTPLPARSTDIGLAVICLACGAATTGEVESLNAGWGCVPVDGRACWYCPTCYERLVDRHPDSLPARLWRARRAREWSRALIVGAMRFLDDVEAVTARGDEDALERLADALLPCEVQAPTRRLFMNGIMVALSNTAFPHRYRFADGTTMKDATGESAQVPPDRVTFPLFRWWLRKEAWRESAHRSRPVDAASIDLLPEPADAASETVEYDLAAVIDAKVALSEIMTIATPRQRDLLTYLLNDPDASLADAADATEMSRSTARNQMARLRRQANPIRAKYREKP